jgi:hypothetical protein
MLQDRVKTEKDLVSVEDMTLRLWVAEVDSVSFGPDTERALMSIRGLPEEAERLSAHLAQCARQQAMIVSPQSDQDMQRLAVLNKVNPGSLPPSLANAATGLGIASNGAAGSEPAVAAVVAAGKFCSQCGNRLEGVVQYCSNCGARVVPAPAST